MSDLLPGFIQEEVFANVGGGCSLDLDDERMHSALLTDLCPCVLLK